MIASARANTAVSAPIAAPGTDAVAAPATANPRKIERNTTKRDPRSRTAPRWKADRTTISSSPAIQTEYRLQNRTAAVRSVLKSGCATSISMDQRTRPRRWSARTPHEDRAAQCRTPTIVRCPAGRATRAVSLLEGGRDEATSPRKDPCGRELPAGRVQPGPARRHDGPHAVDDADSRDRGRPRHHGPDAHDHHDRGE